MTSIVLAMIVKDEAHVIERCLASVKPLLSHWVVVDTGSTDGTQDVIRKFMKDVPGEVIDRPWRGFGASRTEAFELARGKAEYALVIDADDKLVIPADYKLPPLDKDVYSLEIHLGDLHYKRPQLFKLAKPWKYVGILHEYAECDEPVTRGVLDGIVYDCHRDGARSQVEVKEKYRRDAETLEKGMKDEPGNARYVFYAAQSWRDAGEDAKARELYRKRAGMVGFVEENFVALLEAAKATERLGDPSSAVIDAYLRAHQNRPTRVEPLYELARHCRLKNDHHLAWLFADAGIKLARPDDHLFLPDDVYSWRMLDEHALAAYWTGRYALALEENEKLLASGKLPAGQVARVKDNIEWAKKGLAGKK